MVIEYSLYDEIEMKKPHPCSARSHRFQILRLGADVKIVCLGCGNILLLDRDTFNHKIKKVVCSHDKPLVHYEEIS